MTMTMTICQYRRDWTRDYPSEPANSLPSLVRPTNLVNSNPLACQPSQIIYLDRYRPCLHTALRPLVFIFILFISFFSPYNIFLEPWWACVCVFTGLSPLPPPYSAPSLIKVFGETAALCWYVVARKPLCSLLFSC
ncbi:hypothetical protein F4803DRAFT_422841 [Xylaria telfairii]|nr:hypothetical protein F4803DRAFT_422841 [Xylaria telfairii]